MREEASIALRNLLVERRENPSARNIWSSFNVAYRQHRRGACPNVRDYHHDPRVIDTTRDSISVTPPLQGKHIIARQSRVSVDNAFKQSPFEPVTRAEV